ncbi:MAG: hypothetical protein EB079_06595, partial [Verrucomicrobia bacterium]|nr:hypothetical protein [Verrucomicrobiota bacterium]
MILSLFPKLLAHCPKPLPSLLACLAPTRHHQGVKLTGVLALALVGGTSHLLAQSPAGEENYVPPWMQEESKQTAALDWYVSPAVGISLIRDTDINQFSGGTSGTTVSSSSGFLSYDPGFR